jgi:TolB-like protein/predicted Zn-dependent protease
MAEQIVSREDVRLALQRVLASPRFARNERMSRFLRVLVERTLDGKAGELKESVIGVEVFGRRPEYDPKTDSVVRTEAARLRTRLGEYYAGDGGADPVVIDVPKGAYVPVFTRREARVVRPAPPTTRRWIFRAAVTGIALAILGLFAWSRLHTSSPFRIAVLPLVKHGRDAGDDFADALTDEMIHNLSVIEGLEVRSRTSSFVFKDQPGDVRDVARQLQVDYVLEGSVLRDGDQLKIDVRLIRARDDVPVWTGAFDRHAIDVFKIQDEISIGIVNNLRLHLGRGRRRYDTSVDAYDRYLHANFVAFLKPTPNRALRQEERTGERYRASIQAFEDAVAHDRNFAPAYAGLAYAYAMRSVVFPEAHPADELSNMQAAADKAVVLDELLPDAHHAKAMVYARLGRWAQAEQSFKRAIELDRNRSVFRADYAFWFLTILGRHDEALDQLRAAVRGDPLNKDLIYRTAMVLIGAGRYREAASYCDRLSDPICQARVSTGEGRLDETIRLLAEHSDATRNPQTRGYLNFALARTGHRDEATRRATESQFANEQALIFAGLGDKARAYEALKRMADLGPQRVGLYLNYPEFAFLRGDERLPAFRQSVGLP